MKTELNELIGNHHLIEALWGAVNTSTGSLVQVAPLVKRILLTSAWKKREVPQLGEVVEFDRLAEFITNPPLRGCGWPLDKVEALIKDDPETLRLWRQTITPPVGTNQYSEGNDNIMTQQGTSRAYTLDRLQREHPQLYARVLLPKGSPLKLSANAAAIQAGFREPRTPLADLRRDWQRATPEERATFLAEIAT